MNGGKGRRWLASAVAAAVVTFGLAIGGPQVARADVPAPADDYVVDGDAVWPVPPGGLGLPFGADSHASQGFNTFSPEFKDISRYTFRLDTNAEAYRSKVTTMVGELNTILGTGHFTLAAGNVTTDPSNPVVPEGEIHLAVSPTSPCGSGGWVGCAGPRDYVQVGGDLYYANGFVWLRDTLSGFGDDVQQAVVDHEVGHTLGLDHFDTQYPPEAPVDQIMRSIVGAATSYQAGDINGLRYQEPTPANDDFANATVVGPEPATFASVANRFASAQAGEPTIAGQAANRTRWYRITAPKAGHIAIATSGATASARIAVFTGGTLGTLTPVTSASPTSGNDARAGFGAAAGTTYSIAVDTATGTFGTFGLTINYDGYTPIQPARIVDSRDGTGLSGPSRWPNNYDYPIQVVDKGGVPATGVDAVVVNVTVVNPVSDGFLTIFPFNQARPLASNLNFAPGQVVANLVTVKVGDFGYISIFASGGNPFIVVDVVGWYGTEGTSQLTPLAPVRILDSRTNTGLSGAWTANQTRTLQVGGAGGVPANATAVVINMTATSPAGSGWLTVFPADQGMPGSSNLNFSGGQTVPNLVITKLSPTGQIKIFSPVATHVIGDVVGYYAATGSPVTPVVPQRLLDTRSGPGPVGLIGPNGSKTLTIGGVAPVPAGATGVVLNVTVTGTTAGSWLAVFPGGQAAPNASNLNWVQGQTVPNLVLVKLGTGGTVTFFNAFGQTHVIADIVAYVGP